MLVGPVVPRILTTVEAAEHMVIRDLAEGRIETEPSLTDRFVGALEMSFETRIKVDGYFLSIKTLRDRGPNASEREFGADLVWILNVDVAEIGISKGFLAQAKMANKGDIRTNARPHFVPEVWVRRSLRDSQDPTSLYSQSKQMLAVSPDSYVFIYALSGIFVLPASSVVSLANDGEAHRLFVKRLRWFIADFANCFVGDMRINAYDNESLRRARDINNANYGVILGISDTEAST